MAIDIQTTLLKAKLSRAEQEIHDLKRDIDTLQLSFASVSRLSPLVEKLANLVNYKPQDIENLQQEANDLLEEIENTI